jgi:hypothetical protein
MKYQLLLALILLMPFVFAINLNTTTTFFTPYDTEVINKGFYNFTWQISLKGLPTNTSYSPTMSAIDNTYWYNTSTNCPVEATELTGTKVFRANCAAIANSYANIITRQFPNITTIAQINITLGVGIGTFSGGGGSCAYNFSIGNTLIESYPAGACDTFSGGNATKTYNYMITRINSSAFEVSRNGTYYRTVGISSSSSNISCGVMSASNTYGTECYMGNPYYALLENYTFRNSTIYIWNNTALLNRTTNIISGLNPLNLSSYINVSRDNYYWNIYTCLFNGTLSNCSFSGSNYSFSIIAFSTINTTYSPSTYETAFETFRINVSSEVNLISLFARLIYNGTSYDGIATCNATNFCQISASIDIPVVNTTKSLDFKWNLTYFDGTTSFSDLTSPVTQVVSSFTLAECLYPYSSYTANTSLIFKAYNEQNLTQIQPYSFKADFDYWLGSGTVKKPGNVSLLLINQSNLCISPNNLSYYVDMDIEYTDVFNTTDYGVRNYYLVNASYRNNSDLINLYLLNAEDSVSFILKVIDLNILPIENAYIYTQRCYVGTGTCQTVQMARTDSNGKSVGFFETEKVNYKFIIVVNGTVVLETEPKKIFPESLPYTLEFVVGNALSSPFIIYENLTNLQYSYNFNETTNMFSLTYIDVSGSSVNGNLIVGKDNPSSGFVEICDVSSALASATLNCNLTGYDGAITSKFYITRTNTNLVLIYSWVISVAKTIFSLSGILMSILIILVVALITIYNPVVQILAVNVTLIVLNLVGLLTLSPVALFGIMAVSSIILVVLKA